MSRIYSLSILGLFCFITQLFVIIPIATAQTTVNVTVLENGSDQALGFARIEVDGEDITGTGLDGKATLSLQEGIYTISADPAGVDHAVRRVAGVTVSGTGTQDLTIRASRLDATANITFTLDGTSQLTPGINTSLGCADSAFENVVFGSISESDAMVTLPVIGGVDFTCDDPLISSNAFNSTTVIVVPPSGTASFNLNSSSSEHMTAPSNVSCSASGTNVVAKFKQPKGQAGIKKYGFRVYTEDANGNGKLMNCSVPKRKLKKKTARVQFKNLGEITSARFTVFALDKDSEEGLSSGSTTCPIAGSADRVAELGLLRKKKKKKKKLPSCKLS